MNPFVHLHVHSQYSVLDGQASIQALVDKAIADGMRGIALTDHGNMFGIKEFFDYVKKKNSDTDKKIKELKKKLKQQNNNQINTLWKILLNKLLNCLMKWSLATILTRNRTVSF